MAQQRHLLLTSRNSSPDVTPDLQKPEFSVFSQLTASPIRVKGAMTLKLGNALSNLRKKTN